MKTTLAPFDTGDSILDEMLENKRACAAEHDFDLNRIFSALRAKQAEHPERYVDLSAEAKRKFIELQQLPHPAAS